MSNNESPGNKDNWMDKASDITKEIKDKASDYIDDIKDIFSSSPDSDQNTTPGNPENTTAKTGGHSGSFSEKLHEKIKDVTDFIDNKVDADTLKERAGELKKDIRKNSETLKDNVGEHWDRIRDGIEKTYEDVKGHKSETMKQSSSPATESTHGTGNAETASEGYVNRIEEHSRVVEEDIAHEFENAETKIRKYTDDLEGKW